MRTHHDTASLGGFHIVLLPAITLLVSSSIGLRGLATIAAGQVGSYGVRVRCQSEGQIFECGTCQPTLAPDSDPIISEQIADPLPSWNEGETKTAITRFVTKVTTEGSPDFVPCAQRIAAYDNDGTLWSEQPVVQFEYVAYQIKKMSGQHPEWKTQQPFRAGLEGDQTFLINDITKNYGKGLQKLVLAAHAGMTLQAFNYMSHIANIVLKRTGRKTTY